MTRYRIDKKSYTPAQQRFMQTWLKRPTPEQPLIYSCVEYIRDVIPIDIRQTYYDQLTALSQWAQPTVNVYGAKKQPRETCAFGLSRNQAIEYSGATIRVDEHYPDVVKAIKDIVEARSKLTFNNVLLNKYRNGEDCVGAHVDKFQGQLYSGTIIGVSLGAKRDIVFRVKTGEHNIARKLTLEPGSMYIMYPDVHKHYTHEISRQTNVHTGRISLTFRTL